MVPSLKVPGGPTPVLPADFTIDHFQCYTAVVHAKAPKFAPVSDVTLQDQFGSLTVIVQAPKLLCAPVNKNDQDPSAPGHAGHLACYQVKQTSTPKFAMQRDLFLNNQLGPTQLDAKKPALLCVPATTP